MCGILCILYPTATTKSLRETALLHSRRMLHRGPDASGCFECDFGVLCHERLAIVGLASGAQPIVQGSLALAVNGEIYNHAELRRTGDDEMAASDCDVILRLHASHGLMAPARLQGMFAYVALDAESGAFVVARDHMGIAPLYYGSDAAGRLWVSSELKGLVDVCADARAFPPGHSFDGERLVQWYQPVWRSVVPSARADPPALLAALAAAVERRASMVDVPWGVLLSGGLDSSLVAALAARGRSVKSFSIGLRGAPDLAAAAEVAAFVGLEHHEFVYEPQEGFDALRSVVRHVETYDVTTVRASTPMYLLARKIKAAGVSMVLSGEGADEALAGYLYFSAAPSPEALHEECVAKLAELHRFDCQRANKAMAAWGVEARVPFLDRELLDVMMGLDPAAKLHGPKSMEKRVLREAGQGLLPDSVLWRQKEQFSDGVGYGWIDGLQALAEARYSDEELQQADARFPINPPGTKEALLYRELFEQEFPGDAAAQTIMGGPSVACSTPAALQWDSAFRADPSGRSVGVHCSSVV